MNNKLIVLYKKAKFLSNVFFLLFVFVACLLFSTPPSLAADCSQYASGISIPENFGAAYNPLTTQKELLVKTDCSPTSVSAEIGNGQTTQYIYKYGYIWRNAKWERIEFIPTGAAYSEWLIAKARITIALSGEEMLKDNYLIAYTCSWTGTAWKCGCRDALCSTNYWQLQKFKYIAGTCTENWTCANWSACANNTQTRICTDANNCGTTVSRPALSQSCTGVNTCQDSDRDTYDNCAPGTSGDDGKTIDCDDTKASVNPGASEICGNQTDDNCNGQTNENCVCVNSQTRECGTSVIGACRKGIETCTNNQWGNCVGAVMPTTEICGNGIDEDCNGADMICPDTTKPIINSFSITPSQITVGAQITASYGVSDNTALAKIELWRANAISTCTSGKETACDWIKITERTISGRTNSGTMTDSPAIGSYWYGVHAVDTAQNFGIEANTVKVEVRAISSCTENWTCANWNACANNIQTRTCTDANNCGTTVSRPALSQSCTVVNTCRDNDQDGYDNCAPGTNGDDGKAIDCNDNERYAYPGNTSETCDTVDNNCNGQTDEGCDEDRDGYCSRNKIIYRNNSMCPKTVVANYETGGTGNDCDDTRNTINPEASEICGNGIDEDCSGADLICSDTVVPVVSNFSITPSQITVGAQITASYSVSDNIALARIELWRANSTGICATGRETACVWIKIAERTISGRTNTGTMTDSPAIGSYWYGIHAVDTVGNVGHESNPIRIVSNENSAISDIIFENDFDSLPNWVATYPTGGYPNPTDTAGAAAYCNPGAQGIGTNCNFSSNGFTLPSPFNVVRVQGLSCSSRLYQGLYINSIPGYPYESSGTCYGGSGKCLTVWEELCGEGFDHSDNNIGIALPNEYPEAWVRFRIKFGKRANGAAYYANHDSTNGTMKKLWHFQHWDSETGASPFNYFARDQHNYPVIVGGYSIYENFFQLYNQGRCWCNENDTPNNDSSVNCANGTPRPVTGCCNSCSGYPYFGDPSDVWDNYGSWTPWTSRIGNGGWHTVEIHLKRNTYNSATGHWNSDGIATVYYDGVAGTGQNHWDKIPFLQDGADPSDPRGWKMFAIGGNSYNRDPQCTGVGCWQYYIYDDFCISSSPIGEADCSTPPSTNGNSTTDTTPPTGSVSINNNSAVSSTTNVTLNISASDPSGVTAMKISDTNNFIGPIERAYTTVVNWVLSIGDGVKSVYIWFRDSLGNWSSGNTVSDTIVLDTTGPVISNIQTSNITANSITINWTTNEESTTDVDYGPTSAYGQTGNNPGFRTSHSVVLSNLTPNTAYNFVVKSKDRAGNNTSVSSNNVFRTASETSIENRIYWQDDFNGFTSGWTPSTNSSGALYPWTTNENFDPNVPSSNGGGLGITNYEPSIYPPSQRTNNNSWNGWVQNTNSTGYISIQPNGGVDNSPALRIRLIKYSGLSNETGIQKWLGNTHYQEVYVQYKIKFGSTGRDWWWNGQWDSSGNPVGPYNEGGIIWKLGRVWTGFNPTDYDKTGGQSQPVNDTVWSREANWRTGIWIPGILASPWNLDKYSTFFVLSNFHWEPSCPSIVGGTCDSQNNPRESNMYWDWMRFSDNPVPLSSFGRLNNFTNSGNGYTSTGNFTEAQTFHTIEMRFKNRTNPSTPDGAYQMWIDGVEITKDTIHSTRPIQASMSSNPNDYGINFIRFVDNFNQLTQNIPDNPGYMDLFIDDIVIADSYIGI